MARTQPAPSRRRGKCMRSWWMWEDGRVRVRMESGVSSLWSRRPGTGVPGLRKLRRESGVLAKHPAPQGKGQTPGPGDSYRRDGVAARVAPPAHDKTFLKIVEVDLGSLAVTGQPI